MASPRPTVLYRTVLYRTCSCVADFLCATRGGATALVAIAISVMAVGGAAVITDHAWLVGQRDQLKAATDSATLAATFALRQHLAEETPPSDEDLEKALRVTAKRYILLNLSDLSKARYERAKQTLVVELKMNRIGGEVDIAATADLGGTLFSRSLLIAGNYPGPEVITVESASNSVIAPIEIVLAIDMSDSMRQDLAGTALEDGAPGSRLAMVRSAAKALVATLQPSAERRIAVGIVPWNDQVKLPEALAAEWAKLGYAKYPKRRDYPIPYNCKPHWACTVAPIDEATAPIAPEDWAGCLDDHRMGGSGTHAHLASKDDWFTTASASPFVQNYFHPVSGSSYRCLDDPLPANYASQVCFDEVRAVRQAVRETQRGCTTDMAPILPLSTDSGVIERAIDALESSAARTYSANGVLWAQRLLEPKWRSVWGGAEHPVDPMSRKHKGVKKIIVLLTDGEDSYCGWDNHSCENSVLGIARTAACDAVKKRGTTIYVVAAMASGSVSEAFKTALKRCSSGHEDSEGTYLYADHENLDSVAQAFTAIGGQLLGVQRTQ